MEYIKREVIEPSLKPVIKRGIQPELYGASIIEIRTARDTIYDGDLVSLNNDGYIVPTKPGDGSSPMMALLDDSARIVYKVSCNYNKLSKDWASSDGVFGHHRGT